MAEEMGIEILNEEEYRSYNNLAPSIQKPPVGWQHQLISGKLEGQYLAIAGITMFSYITTEQNLIMLPGDSGAK